MSSTKLEDFLSKEIVFCSGNRFSHLLNGTKKAASGSSCSIKVAAPAIKKASPAIRIAAAKKSKSEL